MNVCPFCKSADIFYVKKHKQYICGACASSFETPAVQTDKLKIFFSYGHDENTPLVDAIKEFLESRGHDIWIDKSRIKVGDDWRSSITDGIMKSEEVLSFLSCHSVRDPGVCLDELRIALCVKYADVKTVLLEKEEDVSPPLSVASRQWLDMSDWKEHYGSPDWGHWFVQKMEELCACIESKDVVAFNGDVRKLSSFLQPTYFGGREKRLVDSPFMGRTWLFDVVATWKQRGDSSKFFMLTGVPGSGKSTFASHLLHYDPDVIAGVFFEFDRKDLADGKEFTKLLAFQIATKLPVYRYHLVRMLNDENHRQWRRYADSQLFDWLILDPLHFCIDGNQGCKLIILDALDEVYELNAPMVRQLLRKLEQLPKWIKVLVTSRRSKDLASLVDSTCDTNLDASNRDNTEDIALYVRRSLSHLPEYTKIIENQIVEFAEGSFLFAVFFCGGILRGDMDMSHLDGKLRGINAFYAKEFDRIFDAEDYQKFLPILEVLAVGKAVPYGALCEIAEVEKQLLVDFQFAMGALVKTTEVSYPFTSSKLHLISFAHKTMNDWLRDPNLAGRYSIDVNAGLNRITVHFMEKVRLHKSVIPLPNRYAIGRCPQIEIDLELKFMQDQLSDLLLSTKQYEMYTKFLLEKDTPLLPYWADVDRLPAGYDMQPLVDRLEEVYGSYWEHVRNASYRDVPLMAEFFITLSKMVRSDRFSHLFEWTIKHTLIGFFRSSASDCYQYSGLLYLFNADKVYIGKSAGVCMNKLLSYGADIPLSIQDNVNLLKLSCCYCEGEFSDMKTLWINFSYIFTDEVCSFHYPEKVLKGGLKENYVEFNTACLAQCYRLGQDGEIVQKLIECGADVSRAKQMGFGR